MDALVPVIRGGEIYYCFIQVKHMLFPNVPKSTLRWWMKELNVSCVPCSAEERDFLKVMLPNLSGAFGILKATHLKKILEYKEEKRNENNLRYSSKTGTGTSILNAHWIVFLTLQCNHRGVFLASVA